MILMLTLGLVALPDDGPAGRPWRWASRPWVRPCSGGAPIQFTILSQKMQFALQNFVLLAIPLFILAAKLMNTAGISMRIFRFADTLVGFLPGGLAHANILGSLIFSGMSGAAVVDAAGLGQIEHRRHDQERLLEQILRRLHRRLLDHRPDLPAQHPDGRVLLRLGGLGRPPLPGRRRSRASHDRARSWSGWHPGQEAQLSAPTVPDHGNGHEEFRRRGCSAAGAGHPAGRDLVGDFHADRGRRRCRPCTRCVVGVFVLRELSLKDVARVFIETARETAIIGFLVAASTFYGWVLMRTGFTL